MTLAAEEFTRRFLLHVLPKGLLRIRYYGWMANRFTGRSSPNDAARCWRQRAFANRVAGKGAANLALPTMRRPSLRSHPLRCASYATILVPSPCDAASTKTRLKTHTV
jgi:hypothetical protein